MKNRIELTIEHEDHTTVVLTNDQGDTFTYNPIIHEGLEDFLSGAKIVTEHVFIKCECGNTDNLSMICDDCVNDLQKTDY